MLSATVVVRLHGRLVHATRHLRSQRRQDERRGPTFRGWQELQRNASCDYVLGDRWGPHSVCWCLLLLQVSYSACKPPFPFSASQRAILPPLQPQYESSVTYQTSRHALALFIGAELPTSSQRNRLLRVNRWEFESATRLSTHVSLWSRGVGFQVCCPKSATRSMNSEIRKGAS